MYVYNDIEDLFLKHPTAITVGTFDGVHLGHKYTFDCLKQYAEQNDLQSVIVTFSDHPREIIQHKKIRLLTTIDEKIKAIKKFKINHLVILPFDEKLASMEYRLFTDSYLIDHLNMRHLLFGYDHAFGKGRKGSFENLTEFAADKEFKVSQVESIQIDNITIGSRLIRDKIEAGDIETANRYIGRPYSFTGVVIEGDKRGKQIGFPTANLKLLNDHKLIPSPAVYAVKIEYKQQKYHGMMNIGTNPTFDGQKQKIEINIFAFNQNIYEEEISVFVLKKIRNEQRFLSSAQLSKQLSDDKQTCLALFR